MSANNSDTLEGISGINGFLMWLGILLGVTMLIAIAYFLSKEHEGLINWAMYAIITGLGIGLIHKGYMDAKFIQNQSDLASQQIKLLEYIDNMDDFLTQTKPSIFRSHIENLYTIAQAHVDVSQDNLIELLHARLVARNKVVELFASILITLGLIGTILGLILMMDGLTHVMKDEANKEHLMTMLVADGGPLAGLGVAFITTLLGATLGGVVLRVLTNVVNANIMTYTAHIAELTEVYVLPYLRTIASQSEKANEQDE